MKRNQRIDSSKIVFAGSWGRLTKNIRTTYSRCKLRNLPLQSMRCQSILDLGPRVRVGVDRFQSAGADMGVNFRRDDARVAEQPPLTPFRSLQKPKGVPIMDAPQEKQKISGYTYGTAEVAKSRSQWRNGKSSRSRRSFRRATFFTCAFRRGAGRSGRGPAKNVAAVSSSIIRIFVPMTRPEDPRGRHGLRKAVGKRFGQWVLDTARAKYDRAWLDYQYEIGLGATIAPRRTRQITDTRWSTSGPRPDRLLCIDRRFPGSRIWQKRAIPLKSSPHVRRMVEIHDSAGDALGCSLHQGGRLLSS